MVDLLRFTLKQRDLPPKAIEFIFDAFKALRETAEPAVPYLLELAQGPEGHEATMRSIGLLGWMGPVSREQAAPIIAKILFTDAKHRQQDSLIGAMAGFGELSIPLALEELKLGEKNNDLSKQDAAIKVIERLGLIGINVKAALPDLKRIAEDKRHQLRTFAQLALSRIQRTNGQ